MPGSARGWNPTPRGPPPPPRPKYDASKREQEILAAALSGKSPDKKSASDALGEGSPERGQAPCDGGEGLLQQQQQQQQQLQKKKTEEAPSMHHGGSIKTYMQLKNTKLQEQFEANSLQLVPHSSIFQGVSIFVNGYTQPTHAELRQIMLMHGGRFETYFYRDKVTHYVCQNLPDTKIKMLAHERNPPRIVRPEWITASLQAGRLLPVQDFQLSAVCDKPGQRKIMDFKQHDTATIPPEQLYPQLQQQQQQQQQTSAQQSSAIPSSPASSLQGNHPQGSLLQQHVQQQQQQQQGHQQQACPLLLAPPSFQPAPSPLPHQLANHQQALFQGQVHLQQQSHHHHHHQQQQYQHHQEQYQHQHQQQQQHLQPTPHAAPNAAGASGSCAGTMEEAQALCARLRSECDLLRGAPRSSRDDPQFMDSYFRSSRLHFIGTWKSRIEALMAEDDVWGPQPLPIQGARQAAGTMRQFMRPSTSSASATNASSVPGTAAITGSSSSNSNPRATTALPPQLPTERAIIHLDMDCFFAAASVVDYPVLRGKPLVVCHSSSAQGTGEVSAANYEARAFGVRASQTIGEAKRLCPHVLVVPYMFDKYTGISEQVYRILMKYTSCVQALSCDEAYLDVTGLGDPEELAAAIRAEIHATTQCTASAGIGPNMLLARIATGHGKPNGQFRVASGGQALDFLADLPVAELPGVGPTLKGKLKELQITHVRQVWSTSRERLQRLLGTKTGLALWQFAHGRDDRSVEPPKVRKSVGAEVNWGIRFDGPEDADRFLQQLATELAQRMRVAGVRGKCVSLKMKRRQEGAPMPFKCLGHGPCDNLSRSITLSSYTDTATDILREARVLYAALHVPDGDVRGLGITMSKLDSEGAVHAAARPSMPPPSKLHAPTPTQFKPREEYTSLSDRPITSPPPSFPSPARTHAPTRTHTMSPLPTVASPIGRMPPPHQLPHQSAQLDSRGAAGRAHTPTKPALSSKAAGVDRSPEPPPSAIAADAVQLESAPSSAAAVGAPGTCGRAALPEADAVPPKPAPSSAPGVGAPGTCGRAALPEADAVPPKPAPSSAPRVDSPANRGRAAFPEADSAAVKEGADVGVEPPGSAHTHPATDEQPCQQQGKVAQAGLAGISTDAACGEAEGGVPRGTCHLGTGAEAAGAPGPCEARAAAGGDGGKGTESARGGKGGADKQGGRVHKAEERSEVVGARAQLGLPASANELDPEVLQALPLQMRREIEAAYGLSNSKQPSKPSVQPRQQPKQKQQQPLQQHKRTRAQQPRASHNPSKARLHQTTLASSFSGTGKPAHKQHKPTRSTAATTTTTTTTANSVDSAAAAAAHNISAISCWVTSRPQVSGSVNGREAGAVGVGGGDRCMGSEGEGMKVIPRSLSHNGQAASERGVPDFVGSDGEGTRQRRLRDIELGEGDGGNNVRGKRRKTLERWEGGGGEEDGTRQGRALQACMEVDSPMLLEDGRELDSPVMPDDGREVGQKSRKEDGGGAQQQQQQQQQRHQRLQGQSGQQLHRRETTGGPADGGSEGDAELVQSPCLLDQLQHLTCSQVDPLELAQLPPALQQEVMRELKPRPKHTAIPKAGSIAMSRGGATHVSAGIANLSTRARADGGKVEVTMGNASKVGQVAGKQQPQQQQQQQQQNGGEAPLVPCPYLMAQPPAAVRRDFRDFMRSACRVLRALELSAADGAGAAATAPESAVGTSAFDAHAPHADVSDAGAPDAGHKVPSGGLNAGAAEDCAVQYDLKSACARMEGWALAHCGNLEETGKTLGVLEGLLCGVGMPAWVMEMVRRLLCSIRAAVHARYGVHLLPL